MKKFVIFFFTKISLKSQNLFLNVPEKIFSQSEKFKFDVSSLRKARNLAKEIE